jgi:hypothetical protein
LLIRVCYDRKQHQEMAERMADATVQFFCDGLDKKRAESPSAWADEFIPAWTLRIGNIAPMVKDEAFRAESEFRIVHQLQSQEMGQIRFTQKKTLMSRHLPLVFPQPAAPRFSMLPVVGVKVGPTRHTEITRISVDTLLTQLGYGRDNVTVSSIPFQQT